MLKNYLRVALRNLRNNKIYSLINVIGLAVGIACCIIIVLYVNNELGYDKFNKRADQIYRPVAHIFFNGRTLDSAPSPSPLGPALQNDFPQVVSYTRMRNFGTPVLRYGDKVFNEPRFLVVDSTFFDVFTVHFLEGNPKTVLTQPNSVVLTESMAKKYFGNADPIGKILNADNNRDWIVTGVIEDWPKDSHFKFDFLGSLCTYSDSRIPWWLSNNYYTYLLLRKGTDPASFQRAMNRDLMKKYLGPQLKTSIGISGDQFTAGGGKWEYSLQPLASIHLYSHLDYELQPNGDISYVYVFSSIAIGILLIACVNFVNLATARSEKRSKEVGIRKTLGSKKSQLVRQFLTESVVLSLLAVLLAIGLVELFLPLFNGISGKDLSLRLFESVSAIPLLAGLGIGVGLLAGIYPAFYLSSFQPSGALKVESFVNNRRSFLRGALVVFQFVVSIVLFVGTFVIHSQLEYIQNKNLGFDKEQVIVIKRAYDLGTKTEEFKHDLLTNSKIVSVSSSTAIPGDQNSDGGYWVGGTSIQHMQDLREMWADYDFLRTYGMSLAGGRYFSPEHPADSGAVVVNQQVERVFGFKDLVGRNLMAPGQTESQAKTLPVVGVVSNFNFESLHQAIRPLVIRYLAPNSPVDFVSVRVRPADYRSTISFIEKTWKKYAGNEAIDYAFLDQDLARLYVADQRTSEIATAFSVLAIFVACLGLLGLAAFVTERRTKEIGIRKVLGASIPEILGLLTSEFVKWILVANAIAWPVAYFVMNRWLQNFAYRVDLDVWIFVLAGSAAMVIALVTVGSHTLRAATANPVEALRYE